MKVLYFLLFPFILSSQFVSIKSGIDLDQDIGVHTTLSGQVHLAHMNSRLSPHTSAASLGMHISGEKAVLKPVNDDISFVVGANIGYNLGNYQGYNLSWIQVKAIVEMRTKNVSDINPWRYSVQIEKSIFKSHWHAYIAFGTVSKFGIGHQF